MSTLYVILADEKNVCSWQAAKVCTLSLRRLLCITNTPCISAPRQFVRLYLWRALCFLRDPGICKAAPGVSEGEASIVKIGLLFGRLQSYEAYHQTKHLIICLLYKGSHHHIWQNHLLRISYVSMKVYIFLCGHRAWTIYLCFGVHSIQVYDHKNAYQTHFGYTTWT